MWDTVTVDLYNGTGDELGAIKRRCGVTGEKSPDKSPPVKSQARLV